MDSRHLASDEQEFRRPGGDSIDFGRDPSDHRRGGRHGRPPACRSDGDEPRGEVGSTGLPPLAN